MADQVVTKANEWLQTMYNSSALGIFQHWKHLRADHVPDNGYHFENFLPDQFIDHSNFEWLQFRTELPLKVMKMKNMSLIKRIMSVVKDASNMDIAFLTLDYSDPDLLKQFHVFFTRFSLASVLKPLTQNVMEERSGTPHAFLTDSVYQSLRESLLFVWCIERRVCDVVYHRLNQFVSKNELEPQTQSHLVKYHDELLQLPLRAISGLLDCCTHDSFYEMCRWYLWIVMMDICAAIKILNEIETQTKMDKNLFGAWLDYMMFMKFASECNRDVTFFTQSNYESYVAEIVNYLNANDKTKFNIKVRSKCFKVLEDNQLSNWVGSRMIPFAIETQVDVPDLSRTDQMAIFLRYRSYFYNTLISSVASLS